MPTLSVRVVGLDKLQTGFNQYSQAVEPVTRAGAYGALDKATKKSPGYLGGNSYSVPNGDTGPHGTPRTGNLGRSTYLEQDGLSSRLHVDAYSEQGFEYGAKVLGNADGSGQGQAYAHWPTLRAAVDEQVDILTQAGGPLDSDLQDAAGKAGL